MKKQLQSNHNGFALKTGSKAGCKGTCWQSVDCSKDPIFTIVPVDCKECKQIGGKAVLSNGTCGEC